LPQSVTFVTVSGNSSARVNGVFHLINDISLSICQNCYLNLSLVLVRDNQRKSEPLTAVKWGRRRRRGRPLGEDSSQVH